VEQAKVEFHMIYRRQTLAWEATDVTLASVGLPQARSAEEATEAQEFTRQTLTSVSISFTLREAIGLRSIRRGMASVGLPSDASDGLMRGLGAY
jgi:hypothetical protein